MYLNFESIEQNDAREFLMHLILKAADIRGKLLVRGSGMTLYHGTRETSPSIQSMLVSM